MKQLILLLLAWLIWPVFLKVVFIQGNVESGREFLWPYDAVVGVSVLHHLDLSLALPNLIKGLKPTGRFVFTELNLRDLQVWLWKNVINIKKLMGDSSDELRLLEGRRLPSSNTMASQACW